MAFFVLTMLIGAALGLGIAAYNDYAQDDILFNGTLSDYIFSAFLGGALGATIGLLGSGLLTGSFLSNIATVKNGIVLTYNMFKAGGATAAFWMMYDNLSNSFNNPLHVFWSGGDIAKNQALSYAKSHGGTVLEMTHLGKYLETHFSGSNFNSQVWTYASQNYANQVKAGGTVRAILYYPAMRPDSIWFLERIALMKKNVQIIIGSL